MIPPEAGLFTDDEPESFLDLPGRRTGGRQPQTCTCHPPTQGHLYGPALTCLNRGCGVPYGTLTPCSTPGRRGRKGFPPTQLSVELPQ
jgi:hypothetical protein